MKKITLSVVAVATGAYSFGVTEAAAAGMGPGVAGGSPSLHGPGFVNPGGPMIPAPGRPVLGVVVRPGPTPRPRPGPGPVHGVVRAP